MLAEARAAAALNHPNIVTIHTVGTERGMMFSEMELGDGHSLARLPRSGARVEAAEATRLMVDVGTGLAAAHGAGIVHRDVKPANVLVSASGVAKLGDFGLARRVVGKGRAGGRLAGTPHYMAPELFGGAHADERSDVYAMGATYHALLVGGPPFVGTTLREVAHDHPATETMELTEVGDGIPAEAIELTRRCLSRRPEERPADGAELHRELRAVYGSIRSLDSLLREALAGIQASIRQSDDGYAVVIDLERGRTQEVHVEASSAPNTGERLIRLFSVCGPTNEQYFRLALEFNARLPHGTIAIERFEGHPHFVMVRTFLRATCEPDDIRHSVLDIANHADEIERRLTGGDRH
jgi:serine/threonine-protein kinase